MEFNYSLGGRTRVYPPSAAREDRYKFMSTGEAEPNLGVAPFDPLVPTTDFYVLTSNQYGERGWAVTAKPYVYSDVQSNLSIQPYLGDNDIYSASLLSPFPVGSVISNGRFNEITYGLSFIGTGTENRISAANVTGTNGYNLIGNGLRNNIKISIHSTILNGRNNNIETVDGYNTIINGRNHNIKTSFSNIFNGIGNTIDFITIANPVLLTTLNINESAFVADDQLADSIKLFSKNVKGNNYLFVGSPYDDTGKVLIYKLIENNISYIEKLSGDSSDEFFGYDIDIDEENSQLYISSPNYENFGAVYVYDINTLTDEFTLSYVLSSEEVEEYSKFGHSISVSPFNLIVGAPYDNLSAGSVHFYKRTDTLIPFKDAEFEILSGNAEEYFGYAVNSNIYTSQDSKLSGSLIITAPNYSTIDKTAVGNFYLYSIRPSADNFSIEQYYSADLDFSEVLTENSRLGDTRFVKSLYSNSQFKGGFSEFYVGAPYYQSENSELSSSIGGIFRVFVNDEFADGLNVLFIPKYESSFAFTTAYNMGYSIGSRKESNDLVKSWGVPSLGSDENSGEVIFYDYDRLRYNSIKPSNVLNNKLFGSSITDLTSSYKIISYFDRSDNSPKVNVYTYQNLPKASYSTINNGSNNRIRGGESAYIALGDSNLISTATKNTAIFGSGNTIQPTLSNVFIFGSNIRGDFSNTTYVENLSVTRKLFAREIENDDLRVKKAIIDDLTVTNLSAISATIDYLDIKFFELSGFDVKGNLNVTDTISSKNIISEDIVSNNVSFGDARVSTISALSATFTVLDVQGYEVAGFATTGSLNVSGNGNFAQNINVLNTVNTLNFVGGSNNNVTATSPHFVFGSNNQLQSGAINSFILGSNIIGDASNYLYVNSISATGDVEMLGDIRSKTLNNVSISLGAGEKQSNIAIGVSALNLNTQGEGNVALGRDAMARTTTGIFKITVTYPGSGYFTPPTVQAVGGNPRIQASLQAVLSASYYLTISSTANGYDLTALELEDTFAAPFSALSAEQFVVSEVLILDRGSGYTIEPPQIQFTGGFDVEKLPDFKSATAVAVLDTGSNNIAIGFRAGLDLSTGSDNILIGLRAGQEIDAGDKNIVVGNYNYLSKNSDNNTVIGYNNNTRGYENVIILGNNLSATKSNFAFMSALDLDRLEVRSGSFGDNLTVSNGLASAFSMFTTTLTAISARIANFDGQIAVNQISPSNAIDGQAILYNDGVWYPGNVIGEFTGTRLHDFQLTSYDANFQVVTADTSYCGVAPSGFQMNDEVWRVIRLKFDDGGLVYEQGITVNIAWGARYDATYILF